ncbi:hypothetical protein GCM10025876_35280 [Demequina litorisediminis]|uniref:Uncharacterized protein n=1 Tax=Demequina litorisediminis TaxID=1849022 RepID=A0ABQ6IHW6_9MICO|nr:hypothetical protein GCM10025876_35280 [Demequina litorisediminis]
MRSGQLAYRPSTSVNITRLAGAQRDRDRCRGGVRVDVEHRSRIVKVGRDGADHGDAARVNDVLDRGGVDLDDVTHQTDVDGFAIDLSGATLGLQ